MAPSNCTLKYLPLALAGTVKCLRYQATPKNGSPPSCGLILRSNGPSMAQSWGRSSVRQAASLKADCSAPGASPLKKRQSSVIRMRRSAPILISVEAAAAARPPRDSSNNVAANEERERFRIFDSKNQVSAFCRDRDNVMGARHKSEAICPNGRQPHEVWHTPYCQTEPRPRGGGGWLPGRDWGSPPRRAAAGGGGGGPFFFFAAPRPPPT